MGETKSEPPKIKVVDRRKFSAEGDPLETPGAAAEEAADVSVEEETSAEETAVEGEDAAPAGE